MSTSVVRSGRRSDGSSYGKQRRAPYKPAESIGPVSVHPYGFDDQGRTRSDNGRPADAEASFRAANNFQQLASQAHAAASRDPRLRQYTEPMLEFMNPARPDHVSATLAMAAARAEPANAIAKALRENTRHYQTVAPGRGDAIELPRPSEAHMQAVMAKTTQIAKGSDAVAKSVLDVGTSTNFASITGGQSLGYVSLDTRIARGTVRPDSFTLYQMLPKSPAFQVVDYWAYIDDLGGPLPGGAFSGFSGVSSGNLTTDVGIYSLQNVNLKLALDGRAVTTALMAQNSFVDVVAQENANAALTVLGSMNWASYFGNPTIFVNMPAGLANTTPTANIFDYQTFYNNNASINGWSIEQALYNMIYEVSAVITSWGRFGRITHAMMTPTTNGALQGLVTTTLNNITTVVSREQREFPGIVVDGDLQGMRTRMGVIQFALDLFITAREIPAQGQPRSNGTTPTTTTAPTPAVSVVPAATSGATVSGTAWGIAVAGVTGAFINPGSNSGLSTAQYVWAVASTDANSNESVITFSSPFTGVFSTSGVTLTITPPVAADATAFRIFRSGNGYNHSTSGVATSGSSGFASLFRYIGTVAANGGSAVTYVDLNTTIPGAEPIFLLDMREEDNALDYRYLLPLTRIELFAQNLYMPWAVASIGAIRNRIPKFHGIVRNFLPDNPTWSPLAPNG